MFGNCERVNATKYEFSPELFWNTYVEIENKRLAEKIVLAETESDSKIILVFNRLFRAVKEWYTYEDDISLFGSIENEREKHRSCEFWYFFLLQSRGFSAAISLFNILTISILIFLLTRMSADLSSAESSTFQITPEDYLAIYTQLFLWLCVHLCFGIFFIAILYNSPHVNGIFMVKNAVVFWIQCGRAMIAFLAVFLVYRFASLNFDLHKHSYGDTDLRYNSAFSMRNMLQVMIDVIQTFSLYALPFPRKYFCSICILIIMVQIFRLVPSSQTIGVTDDSAWILNVARIGVFFKCTLLCTFSSAFEHSARESYRMRHQRLKLAEERRIFLNLLCSEIKVPLQYILLSIENLSNDSVTGVIFEDEMKEDVQDLQPGIELSRKLYHEMRLLRKQILLDAMLSNWLLDDILLLMRMEEWRFTFRCNDHVNLRNLFNESIASVNQLMTCRLRRLVDSSRVLSLLDFTDIDVPDTVVRTSHQCLSVIARWFVLFAWRDYTTSSGRTLQESSYSFEGNKVQLTVIVEGAKGESVDVAKQCISITLHWKNARSERDGMYVFAGSDIVKDATGQLICGKVAAQCSGHSEFGDLTYSISIPCREVEGIFNEGSYAATESRRRNRFSTTPTGNGLREEQGNGSSRSNISACLVLDDRIYETMIRFVLEKIQMNQSVSIQTYYNLDSVSIESLSKYGLIFLTSFGQCKILREAGFQGLIVLFSGESSYLDEVNMNMFDFILPLPCLDSEVVSRFSQWLLQQKELLSASSTSTHEERENERNHSHTNDSSSYSKMKLKTSNAFRRKNTPSTSQWSLMVSRLSALRWFFAFPLPQNSTETYIKWRMLNPTNSYFHYSNAIHFSSRVAITRFWFIVFTPKQSFDYKFGLGELPFSLMAIILLRDFLHKRVLAPLNISFGSACTFVVILHSVAALVYIHLGGLYKSIDFSTYENLQANNSSVNLSEFIRHPQLGSYGFTVFRYVFGGGSFTHLWVTIHFPR